MPEYPFVESSLRICSRKKKERPYQEKIYRTQETEDPNQSAVMGILCARPKKQLIHIREREGRHQNGGL